MLAAWKGECLKNKGFDTLEKWIEFEKTNHEKYVQINSECDREVQKKEDETDYQALKDKAAALGVFFRGSKNEVILPDLPSTGGSSATPSEDLVKTAKEWLTKNEFWQEGMTLEKVNDNTIKWTLPDGQSGNITKQGDGSFK